MDTLSSPPPDNSLASTPSRHAGSTGSALRALATPLAGIVVLALVLRVASMLLLTGTIDWEGGEYARLAENLLRGNGYVGLDLPGKNLMFPPLFPYAIAAVSLLTPDFESAARLISIVTGSLLPIPVFLLARNLYSRSVGYVAAALVAVHPLLVHFSATACSEPTYLFLLVTAIHLSIKALQARTARSFVLAGAVLGLAYLTRIEAAVFPAIVFVIALCNVRWIRDVGIRKALARASCLPMAFLIVGAPYILWLHSETGQWRLEGKSPLNIETVRRVVLEGQNVWDVQYGVNPDLSERGIWIKPYLPTIKEVKLHVRDLARLLWWRHDSGMQFLWTSVTSQSFGTPVLIGMVVLGLFGTAWYRQALSGQLLMLSVIVIASIQTFLIIFTNIRFLLVLLPFLLIGAAAGAVHLMHWTSASIRQTDTAPSKADIMGKLPVALLLICMMAAAYLVAHDAPALKTFDRSTRQIRDIGRQLSSGVVNRTRLVETSTAFSFYADAEWVPFPFCDSDTALRYFDKRQVKYIVLRGSTVERRPYLKAWMQNGIPSPRAVQVGEGRLASGEQYRIYRWTAKADDSLSG